MIRTTIMISTSVKARFMLFAIFIWLSVPYGGLYRSGCDPYSTGTSQVLVATRNYH